MSNTRTRITLTLLGATLVACGGGDPAATPDAAPDKGADITVDAAPVDTAAPMDAAPPPDAPPPDAPPPDAPPPDAPPPDTGPRRCMAAADCAGDPRGASCDTATGDCVACTPGDDRCPSGQYCTTTNACSMGCRNDEACASSMGTARCNPETHQCVQCTTAEHCAAGTLCVGNVCVTGCNTARPCPTGLTCCDNACIDTRTNLAACGACGAACTVANGAPACTDGACAVASCTTGFGNCDMMASNGCEANTQTDLAHCGACGTACAARANATAACASGACRYECATGFADCDGDATNGCETDTRTSVTHCGTCARACTRANATATCAMGTCGLGACNVGFGDCDGDAGNGCETDVTTAPSNCGSCGRACGGVNVATSTCAASACRVATCVAGFGDCDGDAGNGCEVDTRTSAAHCGACGRACALAGVATATCAAGACGVGACATGFGNCDGDAANGCETNLNTAVAHCGACGTACVTGQSCTSGACTSLASCAAILAAAPGTPTGVYRIDPDGTGPVASFTTVCDMTTAGGGWSLVFLKNSAHAGNYANFGADYVTVGALGITPESASTLSTGLAGWANLNTFPYTTMRLAAYGGGLRNYLSNDIRRSDLRIAFGEPGYLLYNDSNGYYWCGGPASYTDGGSGQVNRPAGAPDDCKGHGSLGDGWDFGPATTNGGLTLCGTSASNWMYASYGTGPLYYYPSVGAAYAIWVR